MGARRKANSKQLSFGFAVPTVKVRPLTFEPATRWASTPAHKLGEEVIALHPRGWVCKLEIVGRNARSLTAIWPNAGGLVDFSEETGKAIRPRSDWSLSPEDIAWLSPSQPSHPKQ